MLTSWFMFPALLAGNTILIKPAEDTPLSALYIAKLAQEAGFPPGVINVLPGRGEITGHCIAEHPGVRFISFTGSPGVGQAILRTCDRHGTRMKREMGGNGAAIVLADADPELVARMIGTLHQPALRPDLLHDSPDLRRSQDRRRLHRRPDASSSRDSRSAIRRTQGRNSAPSSTRRSAAASCRPSRKPWPAAASRSWPAARRRSPGKNGFYLKPALYRTEPGLNVQPARSVPHLRDDLPRVVGRGSPAAGQQFSLRTWGRASGRRTSSAAWPSPSSSATEPAQVNCHNSIAYGLPYGGQGISGGPGGGVNCEETFLDYTQVKAVYVADYPG